MPVIRSGNKDHINVFVVQHLTVIQMRALQIEVALMHGIAPRLIDIASRRHVKSAHSVRGTNHAVHPPAAANQTHANKIVRPRRPRRAQSRQSARY